MTSERQIIHFCLFSDIQYILRKSVIADLYIYIYIINGPRGGGGGLIPWEKPLNLNPTVFRCQRFSQQIDWKAGIIVSKVLKLHRTLSYPEFEKSMILAKEPS